MIGVNAQQKVDHSMRDILWMGDLTFAADVVPEVFSRSDFDDKPITVVAALLAT